MLYDWKSDEGKWYYLGNSADESMKTGWIKYNNKEYLLDHNGAMYADCEDYGYKFDDDGVATKLS